MVLHIFLGNIGPFLHIFRGNIWAVLHIFRGNVVSSLTIPAEWLGKVAPLFVPAKIRMGTSDRVESRAELV